MRLFGFARRWTSLCLTRPVTPEVLGSSPVAPVETSCNSALLLSGSAETVAGFCAPRGDPARSVKEAGLQECGDQQAAVTRLPGTRPLLARFEPTETSGGHASREELT